MDNSRLVLVCTGHETAFSHLDTQGTITIHFPVYSNAEIYEAITQQTKKWPNAFAPDALAHLASSVCAATLSNATHRACVYTQMQQHADRKITPAKYLPCLVEAG